MAKLTQTSKIKKPQSFEDALTMAGYGKFNLFVLWATGLCLMCVIIETMCMMFIVPAAQCDLQLGLFEKGFLSSVSFFGVVFSSHFWGFLADTKGRRKILIISLLTSAIASFICSIVPWSWLFIVLRFINGALIGGSSAIIYAYAGEFHNNFYRPKIVSWVATFVAFGNIYLPGMAWVILPEEWSFVLPILEVPFRPWRLLVIIYALPSLIAALCVYVLPESPKFLLTQRKYEEVMKILTKIFCINTGKKEDEYLVADILWDEFGEPQDEKRQRNLLQVMWDQTVPLFRRQFLIKTLMVCFIQFGIFLSTSGIVMWYPEILNSMAHYSREVSEDNVSLCAALTYEEEQEEHALLNITRPRICKDEVKTQVFLVSVILGLVYAVVYIVIGAIINIVGKKKLLISFTIITTVSGIVAQLITGNDALIQILIGLFLLGGAGIGIVNAVVVDLYPTQIRGMALAVSLMFGRFGAMTGSNIAGPILYNLCDYTFFIIAIDQVLVMIVILLLPSNSEMPHLTEPIT